MNPVFVADVLVVVVAEVDADTFDSSSELAVAGPYSGDTGDAASLPTSAVSSIENMNGSVRSTWPSPSFVARAVPGHADAPRDYASVFPNVQCVLVSSARVYRAD